MYMFYTMFTYHYGPLYFSAHITHLSTKPNNRLRKLHDIFQRSSTSALMDELPSLLRSRPGTVALHSVIMSI